MISNSKFIRHHDHNILTPRAIQLYQGLPTEALQFDADKELAGWCCFKALNPIGSGMRDFGRNHSRLIIGR